MRQRRVSVNKATMSVTLDLSNPITYYRFIHTLGNSSHPDLQLIAGEVSRATPQEHMDKAIDAWSKTRR